MRQALNTIPLTPEQAFKTILARIEEQGPGAATTAIRTLSWVYFARRPLEPEELREALVVEELDNELRDPDISINNILDCCLSFVMHDVSANRISFIHPSVQRWFDEEPQRATLLTENYFAKTCLRYLRLAEFHDEDLPDICHTWNHHPFYRYACCFWGDHVANVEDDSEVQIAAFDLLKSTNQRDLMVRLSDWERLRIRSSRSTALHIIAANGLVGLCYILLGPRIRCVPIYFE
jgi:hypothetical protein